MYNRIRLLDILSEAEEKGCPLPTQDIDLNLKNRNKAFKKYKWPTIDVTRKSVEETAASIIKIYEIKNKKNV